METDLIIIGAGVAGLSAGCYAAMNGYRTIIVEMSNSPGGLCTSWKRQGYVFDGSVAGLAGIGPGNSLYRLWQELGVVSNCELYFGNNFGKVHTSDGKEVTIHTNIQILKRELIQKFPYDAKAINKLAKALESVSDLDIPFSYGDNWQAIKLGLASLWNSLVHLPALVRWGTKSIKKFASEFKDPALVEAFHSIVHFGSQDLPVLTLLLPLAYGHRKMAGIPLHGWLDFARSIEKRFRKLGGTIQYNKKATGLDFENCTVRGLILEDGNLLQSPRVLSAVDSHFTQSLLPLSLRPKFIVPGPTQISDQPVQINLGINMDLRLANGSNTWILKKGFQAAGRLHTKLTMHAAIFDPSRAQAGKTAVTIFLDSDYIFWKNLYANLDKYHAAKMECANKVIEILDTHFPGLAKLVEVIDVATPVTRERYTGNYFGAMQAKKPGVSMIQALTQGKPQYRVHGLTGFWQAGQWVEAWGGITTAARSGRQAIQALCRFEGKKFTSQII